MSEPNSKSQFRWLNRLNFARAILVLVLTTTVYFCVDIVSTYRREQQIIQKLKVIDGGIEFVYVGPEIIPADWRGKHFDRIKKIHFNRPYPPTELLSELRSLTKLESVYLRSTRLSDLEPLRGLRNLKVLWLGSNRFTDDGLRPLEGFKSLEKLDLVRNPISDAGLQHIRPLTKLNQLALDKTQITNAGLKSLQGLKQLTSLSLSHTAITDEGLEHLGHLNSLSGLSLSDTSVTDAGLQKLKGLKQLKNLVILRTLVTPQGIAELQKSLPECQIIAELTPSR